MPIIELKHENSAVRWGVWQITESLEDLLEASGERPLLEEELSTISSMELKQEKAATRVLLRKLLDACEISYKGIWRDDCRKPHLNDNSGHISFTHSFPYVGVIYDNSAATGIDIQDLRSKIIKIAPKFMSQKELEYAGDSVEGCTIIWCAKEALYKIHGRRQVIFAEEMFIEPFKIAENGHLRAEFRNNGTIESYDLRFARINDYIIVYKV